MSAYIVSLLLSVQHFLETNLFAHFYNDLAIISLPAISSPLVLACAAKILKIGREIKLTCPELDFSWEFQWVREVIRISKTLNSDRVINNIQILNPLICFEYQLL